MDKKSLQYIVASNFDNPKKDIILEYLNKDSVDYGELFEFVVTECGIQRSRLTRNHLDSIHDGLKGLSLSGRWEIISGLIRSVTHYYNNALDYHYSHMEGKPNSIEKSMKDWSNRLDEWLDLSEKEQTEALNFIRRRKGA